jgi:hypothetical protein
VIAEERSTRLSLAVELVDDFAPATPPQQPITVSLRGHAWRPHPTAGGYIVFRDLPPGDYTVEVRSAQYLPEDREVHLPHADPLRPVLSVRLTAGPVYRFPAGATLLLGVVRDPEGAPVSGAVVRLVERQEASRTAADGRFVLYFKRLTEDDVTRVEGRRLLKAAAAESALRLRITHADYRTKTIKVERIEEGTVQSLSEPIVVRPS